MTASDDRWDVIGVGANSVDFVNLLPGYPQPFGAFAKMQIRDRRVLCGGQMATAMCTCASLGLRSKYVGVSGTDENGRRIRAELTNRDVDITDLIIRDAENQFAVILVDATTGERIVLWDRDDRLRLRERELPTEALAAARVVHVDDVDDDAAIRAAKIARAGGAIVTSDIDRLTDRTEELVSAVTHAIFAQHVPTHLTGTNDIEQALRILRKRHDQVLCVTLGEHGAMILDGDRIYQEPAFSVQAVDTTGAGDVFRGAFAAALLEGLGARDVLAFASAAAGLACLGRGAQGALPTRDQVAARLGPAG
jgi:sulfofructose kinase